MLGRWSPWRSCAAGGKSRHARYVPRLTRPGGHVEYQSTFCLCSSGREARDRPPKMLCLTFALCAAHSTDQSCILIAPSTVQQVATVGAEDQRADGGHGSGMCRRACERGGKRRTKKTRKNRKERRPSSRMVRATQAEFHSTPPPPRLFPLLPSSFFSSPPTVGLIPAAPDSPGRGQAKGRQARTPPRRRPSSVALRTTALPPRLARRPWPGRPGACSPHLLAVHECRQTAAMDPYAPYSRSHPAAVLPDAHRVQRPLPQQPSVPPTTPSRGFHGAVVSDYALRSKYRIPTVDEALPFAPLTSIVPYSPGTLPSLHPLPVAPLHFHGRANIVTCYPVSRSLLKAPHHPDISIFLTLRSQLPSTTSPSLHIHHDAISYPLAYPF
jgi:hypothetical protein